jgi:hypothetical protein
MVIVSLPSRLARCAPMSTSILLAVVCITALVGGCFGDKPAAYDVIIEVTATATGQPLADMEVEFAAARQRNADDITPEEDDLSSLPYTGHFEGRTDEQGRLTVRVSAVVPASFFSSLERCVRDGFVPDMWLIRVSTGDNTETIVIQGDAAASSFSGVTTSAENVTAEVVETRCARFGPLRIS